MAKTLEDAIFSTIAQAAGSFPVPIVQTLDFSLEWMKEVRGLKIRNMVQDGGIYIYILFFSLMSQVVKQSGIMKRKDVQRKIC